MTSAPQKLLRLLPLLLLFGLGWALLRERTELQTVAKTLRHAHPLWLWLAVVVQGLYLLLYLRLQQLSFKAVAVELPLRRVASLWARALTVNVVAPGAGNALFITEASRLGVLPTRAASGLMLMRVVDISGFGLMLAVGLSYLGSQGHLIPGELVASGALLVVIAGWALPLLLAATRPQWLRALFARLTHLGQRLHLPLKLGWADGLAADSQETALALAGDPDVLGRLVGFSLLAHLADLASFAALLRAFGVTAGSGSFGGLALAGFGAAVLFWVVTITPEGIGTSEGATILVLGSLGVPLPQATAVAVAFRGLAFYLPLLAGVGISLERYLSPVRALRLIPPTVALFAVMVGGVNLLSAVQPALHFRKALLLDIFPVLIAHGSRLATAFTGFALLALSVGLLRRKRSAWVLAQAALLISVFGHLGKGLDYEEALLSVTTLVLLLLGRKHFHARSDTPTMRRGLLTLLGALGFTLAYGTCGFYLLDAHYKIDFNLPAALNQTLQMFVAFNDPHLQPTTGFGRWFADSIYTVAGGALGYGLLALLAPVLLRQKPSRGEQARARQIVESHGCSSVARFALFDDKVYWFSPGGSLVAYTVVGRVAVALGDPIGPTDDLPATIAGFRNFCEENDWQPSFYHALPDLLDAYAQAELTPLCIGHEAVVELAEFSLAGGARKSLRNSVNRIERKGYHGEVMAAPHSVALLDELESVSDTWLETRGGAEKQFSLGWFNRAYLQEGPIALVRDPDGHVVAFANVISEYRRSESTIDLMRRVESENGVMELLFVTLFTWAKAQGVATFNLGLAPLSGIGESSDDPALDQAIHFLYDHLNTFYGFQGLHAFKDKFVPRWEPRYLVVPHLGMVPTAAIAIIRADNGKVPLWQLALKHRPARVSKPALAGHPRQS